MVPKIKSRMSDTRYDDDSTPAVCDTCLGTNPYVEMKRLRNGAECKICSKPFTVFKWSAEDQNTSTSSRKKTVICLTCARSKNRCQSCLLDLTFGIPVELRDKLLKMAKLDAASDLNIADDVVSNAKNTTSRLYNSNLLEEKLKDAEINHLIDNKELKLKLEHNLQSSLSREKSSEEKKRRQSGHKDPISISKQDMLKLLKSFPFNGNLQFRPKNTKIRSFFFFGNGVSLSMYQIKDYFVGLSPEFTKDSITSLYTQNAGKFGYIEFSTRETAEKIADIIYRHQKKVLKCDKYKSPCLVVISGSPIRVCWASNTNMSASDYNNDQLRKIASVVDKQLIKLSKDDSNSSAAVDGKSKVSKP